MKFRTVDMVHRTRNGEKECEVPHALAILEYLALSVAIGGGILKSEDALIVQEQAE